MIQVRDIDKSFGTEKVLRALSFELEAEKTLSVLGKSGCGKTTLLKILCGLEKADKGHFLLNGQNAFEQTVQKRGVVYLSQEPLLFPHLSVAKNIAFGSELRELPKTKIEASVNEMLSLIGMEEQAHKMPDELSGGQKQRVAFGRALIIQPKVLLLDEPFGALDHQIRSEMQALFIKLREQLKITALFVTHDVKEALLLGDKFSRMEAGQLISYKNKEDFIGDEKTGVQSELKFWQSI